MRKSLLSFLIALLVLFGQSYAQNNCLEFDGTNDYVDCDNILTTSSPLAEFTIEFWMKLHSTQPYYMGVFGQQTTAYSSDSFSISFYCGDEANRFGMTGSWSDDVSGNRSSFDNRTTMPFGTGVWKHVATTFDGTTMKMFVDGVLIKESNNFSGDSYAGKTLGNTHDFLLGKTLGYGGGVTTHFFDGEIDEFRIWDDARTETEIRQNMYRELPDPASETNLVAYYKFNETYSATTADSKGSNTGSLENMTGEEFVTSPAIFGPKNCLEFDGVNDYVQVATLSPTFTQGTISFWIKPKATPTNHARVLSDHWDDDEIYLFSGAGNVATWHMINGDELMSSSPLPNNTWTHVAITMNNTSSQLYINGVLDDESGPSDTNISSTLEIGGYSTSGNPEVVNGYVDEFRIWSDVRTEAEIREYIYKTLTGNEDNLIAYYSFDNTSGTDLQDFSGNGNDGTLTNMTNDDWVSSSAFNTWLNTSSSSWATATNWSLGSVPGLSDNVGVYSYSGGTQPSLTGNLSVQNLFLGEGSNFSFSGNLTTAANAFLYSPLSFASGKTVTINGNLFIDDAAKSANLSLASGASMITSGSVKGTADIDMDITSGAWHFISAPVAGIQSNLFQGNYLQLYNESQHQWEDITGLDHDLSAVHGFSLWYNAGGKGPGTSFTFSGTPFTGTQNYELSFTEYSFSGDANEGANLVGNPYPSYLDWDEVNGYGTKYTWNGADYDERTEADAGEGSRYVAPMEGFFVVTGTNGTAFNLTNAMRTHTSSDKEATVFSKGIVLSANSENYSDALYIVFDQSANEYFELPRDAWKFISGSTGICQIWSQCPDGNLAVDVRPETESIQLGFANNEASTYSISIKEIADISTAILEDTKLNIFHDLSEGAYSFDWRLNDDETRFKLHLNTTAVQEINGSAVQVYVAGGNIIIQSDQQPERITLTDITGRTLGVWEHTETIPAPKTAGVYLVTVASGNQMLTKKIIIE